MYIKLKQGSLILHRYYSKQHTDHYYTTNFQKFYGGNAEWKYENPMLCVPSIIVPTKILTIKPIRQSLILTFCKTKFKKNKE